MRRYVFAIGLALFFFASQDAYGQSDVLLDDQLTTETWGATRDRLPTHVENLRRFVRNDNDFDRADALHREFVADLERIESLALVFSPNESESILDLSERSKTLSSSLLSNVLNEAPNQAVAQLGILVGTVKRLEEFAALSDSAIDQRLNSNTTYFPADWPTGAAEALTSTPLSHSLMSTPELLARVDRLAKEMEEQSDVRLEEDLFLLSEELAALAQTLALRQGDLPPLTRRGFRNTALRMEVIADNLTDFAEDRDRANYRRQILSLRQTLARSREFTEYMKAAENNGS